MRLEQTEGDVDVTNVTKGDLAYTAGMRLGSGDDVDTDTASYAWISLDDSKAIKVDEVSEVEVRQKGKNLEALLISGNLYFNVTVPLKSDESMNIRTSTMATGIRGTCGWVSIVDGCNTRVHLLEGVLHCKVINPVDGQIKTVTIHAGEWADFTVYGVEVFDKNPELISTSDGGQVPVTTPVGTDTASGEKTDTSTATAEPAGNAPGTDNNEDGGSADGSVSDTGSSPGESAGTSAGTASADTQTASSDTGASADTGAAGSGSDVTYNDRPEIPVSPDGESCDISTSRFTEDDIPGFILVELVGDDPLIEKIYDQSGIDLRNLTQEEAEEKLAEKEAETAERMQAIREAEAAQESNISKDPVWEHDTQTAEIPAEPEPMPEEGTTPDELVIPAVTPVQNTPVKQNASTPKSNTPSVGPTTPAAEAPTQTTPVQTTQPAQTADNFAPASGTSGSSDPSTSSSSSNNNNSSSVMTLTMPQTATDVQGYLNQSGIGQVILQPGSGNNTLAVDIDFTVPSGKTLTAQGGVPVDVQSGKTASINGTADLGSSLSNSGTINVNSSHTLKVAGTFTNSGAFNNTSSGKSEFTGGVTNTGSFTTSGILNLNSVMTTSGTLTVSGGAVTANAGINETGGSVVLSGGTLSSTGTALSVSGGSFTLSNGATVTSTVTGHNVALDLSGASTINLQDGAVSNTSTGGAIKVPTGYNFYNSCTDNVIITSIEDNLTGADSIDNVKDTLGLVSVWDGEKFVGKRYQPGAMSLLSLTLDTNVLNKVTIDTITTGNKSVYVLLNKPVPLTITPKTGYQVDRVKFINPDTSQERNDISYTYGTSTSFNMPNGPVRIDVEASKANYTLTKAATPSAGGVISLSVGNNNNPNTAQYQDTVNVNVEPAVGYELTSLTYTPAGGSATVINHTNGIGSFSMPAANVTVNAAFTLKTYNLSATTTTSTAHGLVQVNPNIARMGDEIIVTTTPDPGYKLSALTWHTSTDTTPQDILTTKKFNMPADAVIIEATFEPLEYNVTLNLNAGTDTTAQIAAGKNVTRYTYGVGAALPVTADVTRDEYIFGGWYTSANPAATDGSVTAISNTDMGDKVFYAKWVRRTYGISVANGITNGTVTVNGNRTSAASGESISVTTTPANGYKLKSLVYRHGSSSTAIDLTSKTFVMPSYAVTIDAEFEKETYALTLANSGSFTGGTITVTPTSAQLGNNITVNVSPDTGYELETLTYRAAGDSAATDITTTRQFTMPAGAVTIDAVFRLISYNLTINNQSSIVGGTISLNKTTAKMGDTVTVTVSPSAGYKLKTLTYQPDGQSATDIKSTRQFTMPAGAVAINAEFEKETYALTLANSGSFTGGSITVSPTSAQIEDDITVTATPASGYQLKGMSYTVGTDTTVYSITTNNNTGTFDMPAGAVTLYAEFEPQTYAVNLNLNAGTDTSARINSGNITSYVYGMGATLPTDVTRDEYTFGGWYTSPNPSATGSVTAIGTDETEDKTFYAKWVQITYGVTVAGSIANGSVSANRAVAAKGETITVTATPADGYKLNTLYYRKKTGAIVDHNISGNTFEMPNYDVEIGATFIPDTYTVTLEKNDSTDAPATITEAITSYTHGTEVTLPTSVTRAGTNSAVIYTFVGWFTEATAGTRVTSIAASAFGNKTFYAHWNVTYVPSVNSNDQTGSGDISLIPANGAAGQTVTIDITCPTGKVVDTVTVTAIATNTPVTVTQDTDNENRYTFIQPSGPVSVNVTFKNATYTITLNKNDSTEAPATITGDISSYTYGTGAVLPTNVTRTSTVNTSVLYEFAGWYTSQNPGANDTAVLGIPTDATGVRTYYAKWTVKYAPDTSTGIPAGTTASLEPANGIEGQEVAINISALPNGKIVDEVSVKEIGTNNPVEVTEVTPNVKYTFVQPARPVTVDITLTNATYTVTLNTQGGTINSNNVTGYTFSEGATLPTASDVTKASTETYNYEFAGWYTAAMGGIRYTEIATDAYGDKTFYAQWIEKKRVTEVSISGNDTSIKVGESTTLTAVITPSDADNKNVTWSSNYNGAVVTQSSTNGLEATVSAVKDGSAVITVITADGSKTATYDLTILEADPNINPVSTISGGTISANPSYATSGMQVTITIAPENGKILNSLHIYKINSGGNRDGEVSYTPNTMGGTEYTFTMPDSPSIEVDATFTNATYNIIYDPQTGTINDTSSSYAHSYVYGTSTSLLPSNVTKTPTATIEYVFDGWYTDATGGTKVTAIGTNVYGDQTLYAHWTEKPREYDVRLHITGSGAIDIHIQNTTGVISKAANGATVVIDNISPAANYRLKELYVREAGEITNIATWSTGNNSLEFTMPTKAVDVYANFELNTYGISVFNTSGSNFTISSSTVGSFSGINGTALAGETVTVTITRVSGHGPYFLEVGGQSVVMNLSDDNSTYTYQFTMPAQSVSISMGSYSSSGYVHVTQSGTITHGSIVIPSSISRIADATIELNVTPDTGYELDTLTVTKVLPSNISVGSGYTMTITPTLKSGTTNVYQFTMPPFDVTYSATFKNATYGITYETDGGTINDSTYATSYVYGTGISSLPANVTKASTAQYTYSFAGWYTEATGGEQVTAISANDTGAKTLYAHWTQTLRSYSVTKSAGSNGSLAVKVGNDEVTVAANGATVTVVPTPATGYELDTLTYTPAGGSATAITATNGVYSFVMPTGNVTVTATFKAASAATNFYQLVEQDNNGNVIITVYDHQVTNSILLGSAFRGGLEGLYYNNFGDDNTLPDEIVKVIFADDLYPTDLSCCFYEMENLQVVEGLDKLHTENVTDMSRMFYNTWITGTIDLSSFDTSNVTDMSGMFESCSASVVDLSSFDTSAVTSFDSMFWNCGLLETIYASNTFVVSNTATSDLMFGSNQTSLSRLVGGAGTTWNGSNYNDYRYAHIDGGTSNPGYFTSGSAGTNFGTGVYWTLSDNDTKLTFYNTAAAGRNDIEDHDCSEWGTDLITVVFADDIQPDSTAGWFSDCEDLTTFVGLDKLNTSNVTDMSSMFDSCESITTLDLSSFDTSNVTDMRYMFTDCSNLVTLDLTGFDSTNVINSTYMFMNCVKLETIYATDSFNFYVKVEADPYVQTYDTGYMFDYCLALVGGNGTAHGNGTNDDGTWGRVDKSGEPGYFTVKTSSNTSGTATIDLTKWNQSGLFSNVTSFSKADSYTSGGVEIQTTASEKKIYLFKSGNALKWYSEAGTVYLPSSTDMFCSLDDITSIDLTGLDASHTTDMSALFEDCTSLTSIVWGNIDTSQVTTMSNMFNGCSSLASLSLNGFDLSSLTTMQNMFTGCSSLTTLNLNVDNTDAINDMYNMFSGCENLTSLDLSSFTFAGMTNSNYFGEMFTDCEKLERIYVASGTDWSTVDPDGSDAFQCTNLLAGSNGTTGSIIDSVYGSYERSCYGRIDSAVWIENYDGSYTLESGTPGYFTLKGSTPSSINYQVLVNSASNGTVAANVTKAHAGDTVTLTVTPSSNYEIKTVSVKKANNDPVTVNYSGGTYSFTMPSAAVAVTAEFVESDGIDTPAAGSSPSTWFASKDVVRITADVDTTEAIEVGSSKTLIIDSGVTVDARGGVTIASGGVINNYGTFNTYSNMTNNGTFNNYSGNTLNNYGTIVNNGRLVNGNGGSLDGRINNFEGAVIENNGTFINNGGSVVNNDGEIEGNDIIGSGEVNDDSETADQPADDADIPENAEDNTATGDDKKDTIEATTGDDEGESQTDDSDSNDPLNTESRDASAETVEGGSSQNDDDSGSGSDSGDGVSRSGDTQPGGLSDSSGGAQGNDGGDSGSDDTQANE